MVRRYMVGDVEMVCVSDAEIERLAGRNAEIARLLIEAAEGGDDCGPILVELMDAVEAELQGSRGSGQARSSPPR